MCSCWKLNRYAFTKKRETNAGGRRLKIILHYFPCRSKKKQEKKIYIFTKPEGAWSKAQYGGLNKACQKPTNKEGWIDVLINLLTRRPLQRSVGHHQAMYN